jgi:hypothetical protein
MDLTRKRLERKERVPQTHSLDDDSTLAATATIPNLLIHAEVGIDTIGVSSS